MHGSITSNSTTTADENVLHLISAYRVVCAIRDFAFAEINKIHEDHEPQGLRDIASDITTAEGRIFADLIAVLPTSVNAVAALSLYLKEVRQHPLGAWHIDEPKMDVVLGRLGERLVAADVSYCLPA